MRQTSNLVQEGSNPFARSVYLNMKHHTKDKGDIGVGFVIADLISKGIKVCIPISEHLPFDLVAVYPDGSLKRISVKYIKMNKGALNIRFRSSYSNAKGSYSKSIDKNFIDLVAIYCPDTKAVYYINHLLFSKSATLRIEKSKNGQHKGIILADNFLNP